MLFTFHRVVFDKLPCSDLAGSSGLPPTPGAADVVFRVFEFSDPFKSVFYFSDNVNNDAQLFWLI